MGQDQADRQALIDKLKAKLGSATKANAKRLTTNSGYLKYVEQADAGGVFVLDDDKLAADAAWDGLHAVVTNDTKTRAKDLLTRYRRLWVIEDSFRVIKHDLGIRPMYHFKPSRIAAHVGICFLGLCADAPCAATHRAGAKGDECAPNSKGAARCAGQYFGAQAHEG